MIQPSEFGDAPKVTSKARKIRGGENMAESERRRAFRRETKRKKAVRGLAFFALRLKEAQDRYDKALERHNKVMEELANEQNTNG